MRGAAVAGGPAVRTRFGYNRTMRFLDLEHDTLSASDDAGLARALRRYLAEHDEEMTDDEIGELIEGEAYEALDS